MPSIFISFRKVDNRWMRDRVYQALAEAFGANEIFKSGESIPAGGDFGEILRRQAAECKVMLVLIGTAWSDARDAGGGRLLDLQDDWVRVEIATALGAGNRVIPVLLGDAAMLPAPVALPDDIAGLAQLQFLRVPETHLDDGLQRLVTAVSGLLPELAASGNRSTVPPGPAASPAASVVAQNTGGGNAVSVQGGAKNARVAGGNIRETKVHTGGLFTTATTFLTTKAGLAAVAATVIAPAVIVIATTSGGSSGADGTASAPRAKMMSMSNNAASPPAAATTGVPGVKTIKLPALQCKDATQDVSTDDIVTPDLRVVVVASDNKYTPENEKIYDTRLIRFTGVACPSDLPGSLAATLDFSDNGGPQGPLRGLVGSIPQTDNVCTSAANNQVWDPNFDQDVRNLDGKSLCFLNINGPIAVTVHIDQAKTSDPHLPALTLDIKQY